MKNVVTAFILMFLINSVQAQDDNSNFRPNFNNENLLAINSFEKVSVDPVTSFNVTIDNSSGATSEPEESDAIENFSPLQFKYAMLMDVEAETVTNTPLFNFIDDWYGTHYRMGGTTKKGIDCSAFSGTLLSSVYSLSVPRTAREQYNICEHIKKEDLMAGDLVFFNTTGGVSHVGVYLDNNHFVHSCSSQGVMISSLDDSYFSKRFIGGGRVNQ